MDNMYEQKFEKLVKAANAARRKAYAPYSKFSVGAAIITSEGTIYTGCNIENAAYPVGICAERVAVSKAVSEGERRFLAIAIVGGVVGEKKCDFCSPCGMCRQFMREFADKDLKVVLARIDEDESIVEYKTYNLEELLVDSFGKEWVK